jgi:hypothetical protein
MIRKFLCLIGFHKLSEPQVIQYFEIVSCSCCKRRWAMSSRSHRTWELPAR